MFLCRLLKSISSTSLFSFMSLTIVAILLIFSLAFALPYWIRVLSLFLFLSMNDLVYAMPKRFSNYNSTKHLFLLSQLSYFACFLLWGLEKMRTWKGFTLSVWSSPPGKLKLTFEHSCDGDNIKMVVTLNWWSELRSTLLKGNWTKFIEENHPCWYQLDCTSESGYHYIIGKMRWANILQNCCLDYIIKLFEGRQMEIIFYNKIYNGPTSCSLCKPNLEIIFYDYYFFVKYEEINVSFWSPFY